MVGAVGKISAFQRFAEIRIFVQPSFSPKPTQLSIRVDKRGQASAGS